MYIHVFLAYNHHSHVFSKPLVPVYPIYRHMEGLLPPTARRCGQLFLQCKWLRDSEGTHACILQTCAYTCIRFSVDILYIYIYMYTHKIYWYTDIHICTCVIVSTCKAYLKIGVKPNDFVIGWTGVAYFQSMGVSISGGTPKWMVYSGKYH